MIYTWIRIAEIAAGFVVFSIVLEMLRRGKLRERYGLPWLAGGVLLVLFGLFPGFLQYLANLFQLPHPSMVLIVLVITFLSVIQFMQTITISNSTAQIRILNQIIAILELRLQQSSLQVIPRILSTIARLSPDYFLEIPRHPADEFDRTNALRNVLKLSIDCLGATSGSIVFLDQDGQTADQWICLTGLERTYINSDLADTLLKGLAGWVVENRQPALVKNTCEDDRWLKRPWDNQCMVRSAICVPLVRSERIVGIITLVQRDGKSFSENDLALLMAIAECLSIRGDNPINLEFQLEDNNSAQSVS